MARAHWIDFEELKRSLDFLKILAFYGVSVKQKGDQATGFCPLPDHESERQTPSFSANLPRKIWQCFGCGSRGNILDFAVRMEGKSPDVPTDVRQVALKLKAQFANTGSRVEITVRPRGERKSRAEVFAKPLKPVLVNAPLDFELKGLQPDHPYLASRGFTLQTIAHFGLGYCDRGLMTGRVAVPLHNQNGALIGYAGRVVDDSAVSPDCPKYLLPGKRERDGVTLEFRKSLVVYNAHRVVRPANRLVVLEGFPSVWWLTQLGVTDVVALMGASCSPEQAAILSWLTSPNGHIVVLPDGDDAGRRCAQNVFETVGLERPVRWLKLPKDVQPTEFDAVKLRQLIDVQ